MFRKTLTTRRIAFFVLFVLSVHLASTVFLHTNTLPQHGLRFSKDPTIKEEQSVSSSSSKVTRPKDNSDDPYGLPHTSIIAHAPGWTLFRNIYMSNGTLYILSEDSESYPEIRMMTSTGLSAINTPENIAAREPTKDNMDFISPQEARRRWGRDTQHGSRERTWTVRGNTLLFNDPPQFLRHYYHFVAELFFGVQAFWHGAHSEPEADERLAFSTSPTSHPSPPPLDRAIFVHSTADGWRDDPGFDRYFLRAAFPSLAVEHQEDWDDRIDVTRDGKRVWRFEKVLLVDRSAAHRGRFCGSITQRTAAEAWEKMRRTKKLRGRHVGGWWHPVRRALWEFAGIRVEDDIGRLTSLPDKELVIPGAGSGDDEILNGVGAQAQIYLEMPEKIVITYISRQKSRTRKLVDQDHKGLVEALEALVEKKNAITKAKDVTQVRPLEWELKVVDAERLSRDEQIRVAQQTTIMIGVHGNGLTHLVWMRPTRASTVIELFYPNGFAHDYQWTTRALGMVHYAVWNDTYYAHPHKPEVNYPEGFQENYIPVHGPSVAKMVEERLENALHK